MNDKIRMNLTQLVAFCENNDLRATAEYFNSCNHDDVTVDGWIEADFVKRHMSIGAEPTRFWREVEANVTSLIPLK